ncbi:MAG: DNA methyltransferase [Erysipelotrichaceae bacterium]|nr:DNA methyltransferase [Erysipelotrichaceae bacterium]
MSKVLDEDLIYQILEVVSEIPAGSVSTYGQIASLIGRDKNSRLVGKVLSMSKFYGKYPCHRVVNHKGRLVPGWFEQRELLEEEGITFVDEIYVDIKKYKWRC